MEDIIGTLLCNSFIEQPESNQIFGEKQGLFLSFQGTSNREKRTCYIMRSQRGPEKVKGEIKGKQRLCVKSQHTKDIFANLP